MLQRAASNAYSWWWASHIRTKQSKWLEQNLQDMEEKVEIVLKLIEEDGDSFAKRAEMYYKKRPELIHFVEETYRAYRSLAERYDHISTELQNANNTIASVFPEQVQFAMDDEDEYPSTKMPKRPPDISKGNIPNVPPKGPTKDLRSLLTKATVNNKLQPQRSMKSTSAKTVPKSGLTKPQAREEIDKTQKQILSLQTEKEFVKSSYENGLAKYWEIENQIKGMQEKVCNLQDEFGDGMVIEDNEARNLMAAAALKSCQETLVDLQAKQESTAEEARVESKRVKDAQKNLETLKNEFHPDQTNLEKPNVKDESVNAANEKSLDQEVDKATHQKQKLELLREKIKEHYDAAPDSSLTVSEMADKIDELVTKVISLESAVSSQTALVKRLRSENDEIQEQIKNLEGDKATLIGDKKDLSKKVKEMEEKLHQVQDLNQSVENQNDNLQTHFTEATCNLDHISHKLEAMKPDEEVKVTGSSETKEESLTETKLQKKLEGEVNVVNPVAGSKVLQEVKSDEQLKPTVSLRKDELPPEVRPLKESTEHKEMEKSTDGSVKATDALSTSVGNQGKDVSQSLEIKNAVNPVAGSEVLQEAKSDEELKHTVSLRKDEELPPEVRPLIESIEHKEMEKSTDGSATDALSTSAGNQGKDVSQSPEIKNAVNPVAGSKVPLEAKSDEELKATVSQRKEEETLDEGRLSKESTEHKEVEKSTDGSATDALSTSAGTQGKDVSQSPEINKVVSPVAGSKVVQEARLDEELKATVSHLKEEESLDEGRLSKESTEHKETANPADGSLTATDALSTSAGNQGKDVCESPEINNKIVEQAARNEDEPDWQKLFVNGMEGREKILLTEYTITLRNYKDLKKKFSEAENNLFETSVQIKDLKSASAMKDEEIKSLHKKLDLLLQSLGKSTDSEEFKALDHQQTPTSISADKKEDDEFEGTSEIEQKFRSNIDELLEENLDFWLKFSASFHQVQQFETTVQDLQSEISKLEEKSKKQDGSSHAKYSMKSDARPIYKHLMEIQTELNVWLETGALLKDELQCRFTSLCDIQEEITKALKTSAEDGDFKFTSYQAAKFQGEILNMKQENNKVADELQAGMDHVNALQLEIEKTLAKLNEDYRLAGSKKQPPPQLAHAESRSRVPLRSFIFGVAQKKQKRSIFSVVAPAMHKRYQDSKAKSSQL